MMQDYVLVFIVTMTAVISMGTSSAVSMKGVQNDRQCSFRGKIYPINSSFVTPDCTMQCYCLSNGVTSCMDLCSPPQIGGCPVGMKAHDEREPAGPRGSKCFCIKRYCAPEYCYTKNFAKYKIGESFKRGNCSEICTCTVEGQFKCTPVCPKKQCPPGYKLREGKKQVLVGGCSCPKQRCVRKRRRSCKYRGRIYTTKRYFETNNCRSKCRCKRSGMVKCSPLCPTSKTPQCKSHERLVTILVQPPNIAKGRCQCSKRVCVPYSSVHNRLRLPKIKRPRHCKIENKTLVPGQLYLTKDCSDRCRCTTFGHLVCVPLCMSPPITCLSGEERVLVKTPVKGSKCSCTRVTCRPKKSLGKRENECRADGHKFNQGIEYVDSNCSKRCSCSKTGKTVCRPLCPVIDSAYCHNGYPLYTKVRVTNASWCSCIVKTCLATYHDNRPMDIREN